VLDRRLVLGGAGALLASSAQARTGPLKVFSHKSAPAPAGGPVVETTAGKVQGFTQGSVAVFRAIPYGAPAVGANRFRAPQPVQPWKGVRQATEWGSVCPQAISPILEEASGSLLQTPQGEDCLTLAVWTPQVGGRGKLPVMVWHHGGGYAVGGGAAPWYDGARLAARQGVVVVTVTHRLNVFGFLDLEQIGGEAFAGSGNAGMLDCAQALAWVRDNISAFGGDPGRVTIFGESGGAGKVSTLMAMPAARGLFHRAIAESGAALRLSTPEQSNRAAKSLLDKLGIGPGDLAKVQALPAQDIIKAMGSLGGPFGFGPVTDGKVVPAHPFDPGAPLISADVPFMTGSNLTEATFFPDTPLDPLDEAALLDRVKRYTRTDDRTAAALVALYREEHPVKSRVFLYQLIASDYWMRSTVLTQAERKGAMGRAPAYVYQFNWLSPARGGKLHCPHGTEIPFAFDNLHTAPELTGHPASFQILADKMSAAWASFARDGYPHADNLPRWPSYAEGQRAVMVLDQECAVELDYGSRERMAIAAIKARQV
jgi:para-nitrobenzyl esterase